MTMTPLFLTPKTIEFAKVAAEVTLPEDPNTWQNEILQEIYKQAPYIADYEPNVVMDRIDAEQGVAFGHIEVGNKTELQVGAGDPAAQVAGIKHVRIPIIVSSRKLQPFDIVVTEDSKMMPLTERRLNQALFRPQIFDVTSRTPGDHSLISALYPPYRQNYGFGGGGAVMSAGMGKEGERKLLIEAILPTLNAGDYEKLASQLEDRDLSMAYQLNKDATVHTLRVLAGYVPVTSEERQNKLASTFKPSVVQFCRHEGGYAVKTASAAFWQPSLRSIDRGDLVKVAGADVALLVDKTGSATVSMDEEALHEELPEGEDPQIITDYGVYKVQDDEGDHLIGFVFPNLLDLDGEALPMALFTNGSASALQGEIVGVRVGEGMSVVSGRPRGYGTFYKVLPNGQAQAMVPLELEMNFTEPGGETALVGSTVEGRQVQVVIQPQGFVKPVMADETHLLMPEDWRWMPLEKSKAVVLASKPEEFVKSANAAKPPTVTVRADDAGLFSFSGAPIDKVAQDERSFLNIDDALFYLGAMGVSPSLGVKKLAYAVGLHAPVDIVVRHEIEPAAGVREELMKRAAAWLSTRPSLRRDLVKEAAYLPDPMAVDTALSLGFLNPENTMTFVSYLPQLNETQSSLCELLIAARLGMREVNMGAIERSIRAVEEVIEGLNVLAFQKN